MSDSNTITLAHLSDLHVRRGHPERARVVQRALALPEVEKADLVVITGDVTQSGLAYELDAAEELLVDIAEEGRLMVVPGNHDTSLHGLNASNIVNRLSGARREISGRFATLSVRVGKARRISSRRSPWPVRRDLAEGRCVVYGLDSTRAAFGDLLARGCCGESQLDALDRDLDELSPDQRVVIALHHHVTRHPSGRGAFDFDPALELLDKRDVQKLLRRFQVELVLHGHRHRFWHRRFRDTQVIGGASTTLGCHQRKERFVVLATMDLESGEVTARLRYLDRDDEEAVEL
jgi:3',5'-cyclic AMP phosphodiesterase CpdA